MKVAVVEDEAVVARRLLRLLDRVLGDRLETILRIDRLDDALERLSAEPVDLLFLDLDLHGRDGFELLTEAVAGPHQTIVVSARHDQALRAFDLGVLDFVAKPYSEERLRLAVERFEARGGRAAEPARRLAVRKAGELRLVPVDEIAWIQGADDYSELVCDDGSRHLHAKTLAALERILPGRFERVHRSYIVDLERVTAFRAEEGSRYRLRLGGGGALDGEEVPVSRVRAPELRQRFP